MQQSVANWRFHQEESMEFGMRQWSCFPKIYAGGPEKKNKKIIASDMVVKGNFSFDTNEQLNR